MNMIVKLLTEVGPLIAFFVTYKYYGMITATASIMTLSVVSVIITYLYNKKVPIITLCVTVLILVLGSITLLTGDSTFIKIKPTIINILFATVLLTGLVFDKLFLKYIFGNSISLTDENWIIFSKRWSYFFLFLAAFNEVIWRNFSDDLWVKFKVFGILVFTGVFIAFHTRFFSKNKKED